MLFERARDSGTGAALCVCYFPLRARPVRAVSDRDRARDRRQPTCAAARAQARRFLLIITIIKSSSSSSSSSSPSPSSSSYHHHIIIIIRLDVLFLLIDADGSRELEAHMARARGGGIRTGPDERRSADCMRERDAQRGQGAARRRAEGVYLRSS